MANMLMVSALELGHPVLLGVLVIADDAFFHVLYPMSVLDPASLPH